MNSTQQTELTTYTKTFTPAAWWEFQKKDAVVEVIDSETVVNMPGYREIKVTFTWDASKAKQS